MNSQLRLVRAPLVTRQHQEEEAELVHRWSS